MHKVLLTNQCRTSFITICQMLPKGLAKTKSLAMLRTKAMDLGI